MSRSMTAVNVPAGVTVCTLADGTPYRADSTGIVHVNSTHLTELNARGYATTSASQARAAHAPLVITVENG